MKKIILLISCSWMTITGMANNVVISNINLVGSAGNYRVQFDLSWDNGWRVSTGQNNYDGVWVFFKFRAGGGDWQHLTMTGTGNSVPANYTAYQNTGVTKTGAIIHRTNDFAGTTTLTDIELGITDPGFGIDIRGYAIEMVFIPQCSNCIIGDGNGAVESSDALHVTDNTSGSLGSTFSVDVNTTDDATLEAGIAINAAGITGNANFPTGQALWCMKYELSQGAYRDFLNSLSLTQQTTRTLNAPSAVTGTGAVTTSGTNRNFIEIATPAAGSAPAIYGCDANGNNVYDEAADGEWIACNFLTWMDAAAYLDWSGLAPMTEIVYERICRGASTAGANPSVLNEFAWGTASVFTSLYTISGAFTAAEIASNTSTTVGNAIYDVTDVGGPNRNGMFAGASSDRVTSGASFYGVMDMSGNIEERCVRIGTVAGRSFTGLNGNGILSGSGNANTANWPCGQLPGNPATCPEVTFAGGIMEKGGDAAAGVAVLRISLRVTTSTAEARASWTGCRGVLYIN